MHILNSTHVLLTLKNLKQQNMRLRCLCGPETAIDNIKVDVGSSPQPVTDFQCVSYNWEFLTCLYRVPFNPVFTTTKLIYYRQPFYINNVSCNRDYNHDYEVCNTTDISKSDSQNYTINISSMNSLGTLNQTFSVDVNKITIPAKPETDDPLSIIKNTVQINVRNLPYILPDLLWDIIVKPHGVNQLFNISAEAEEYKLNVKKSKIKFTLPYSHWNYTLSLRCKFRSALAKVGNNSLWSEPLERTFTTAARAPDSEPQTMEGGFYIKSDGIKLYWKPLAPTQHNGPNFSYAIDVWRNGVKIDAQEIKLDIGKESATFVANRTNDYVFEIRSRNNLGVSPKCSRIEVPRRADFNEEILNPDNIHHTFHDTNRSYTLSWSQPKEKTGLRGYTIIWCQSMRTNPYECNENIDFKHLPSNVHFYNTAAHNTNSVNLAVAANYERYNTGIHWPSCSQASNAELSAMHPEVQRKFVTAILLQWRPDICPIVIVGYNLTYCEVVAENHPCLEATVRSEQIDADSRNYNITGLKPFTNYKFEMLMFNDNKTGQAGSVYARTEEDISTPPRDLTVTHRTQHSARLSWRVPESPNGIIKSYTIVCNGKEKKLELDGSVDAKYEYNLANLSAFTPYTVYVRANTDKGASTPSNDVHFDTFIGKPPMPTNSTNNNLNPMNATEIIRWSMPKDKSPNGRLEFYEVVVTQYKGNNIVRRRISFVMSDSQCIVNMPVCSDDNYTTKIKIRAVNAAFLDGEVPDKDDAGEEYSGNIVEYNTEYGNWENVYRGDLSVEELWCVGGSRSASSLSNLKAYRNSSRYRLYKSDWLQGPIFNCAVRWSRINYLILFMVILSLAIAVGMYMARKKYKKMSNIDCKLPLALESYLKSMPPCGGVAAVATDALYQGYRNYNGAVSSGLPRDPPSYADSHDNHNKELQNQHQHEDFHHVHNEKHHLLSAISAVAVTQNDSGYLGAANDMETMTNDNAAIPLKNMPDDVYSKQSLSQHSTLVEDSADSETHSDEEEQTANGHVEPEYVDNSEYQNDLSEFGGGGGYVNPSKLMASWQPANMPAASNGYTTLANLNESSHLSGYTTLAELSNFAEQPTFAAENGNRTSAPPGICGYVTQQQLSAFGHHQNYN